MSYRRLAEQVAQTEQRIKDSRFDPKARSREIELKPPIDNETGERLDARRAVLTRTAIERVDLERVIGRSDLLSVSYLERGLRAARSVGRITVVHPNMAISYGTGFMVSPRLMMTNNHVLASPDEVTAASIEFNYQHDADGRPVDSVVFRLAPHEFFFTDPQLDFTLVAVQEFSDSGRLPVADFGFLKLKRQIGKVSEGEYLSIIQHPNGDYKQVAARENRLLKITEFFLWYETDTAPGSSGAPVFNDFWDLVALHHSGVPAKDDKGNWLTVDNQVWRDGMSPDKIKWIANEGARISRVIKAIEDRHGADPLVKEMRHATPAPYAIVPMRPSERRPHPVELPTRSFRRASGPGRSGESGRGVSVTVPLTVTLAIGDATQPLIRTTATAEPPPDMVEEKIVIDPDWSGRKGYDHEFLGRGARRVPFPQLTDAMKKKAAVNKMASGSDRNVLPYHHFSIVMNVERRLAYLTAVNIDGRKTWDLGERKGDRWFYDPRIDTEEQIGNELYADNPLDRGHLVRRLDPVWGDTEEEAVSANNDTFHWTNCSPQHENFNRNKSTWGGIENYILDNALAEELKVMVFTGPVLAEADLRYRGVQIPREFWKVVVIVKKDGNLSATAYLLTQETLIQTIEEFVYGQYRHYQVKVSEIEQLTGLSFGHLSQYDPLAAPVEAAGPPRRLLRSPADIRL